MQAVPHVFRLIVAPIMDSAGHGPLRTAAPDGAAVDPRALGGSGAPRRAGAREQGAASGEARAAALARVNRGATVPLDGIVEWARVFVLAVALFLVVRSVLVEAYKIPSGSMEGTLLVGDFLLVNKLAYGAEVPFTTHRLPRLRTPVRGDVVVFQWPADVEKNFVKRLVGVPGDTLAMRGGTLFVNGAPQREGYATHSEPGADPVFEDFRWQRAYALRLPPLGMVREAAAAGVSPTRVSPTRVSPTRRATVVGIPQSVAALPAPTARPGRPPRDPSDHPSRNNWGPLVVPQAHFFVLGDNRDNSLDSRYWGFVPDSLLRGRPMVVYYSYAPDSAHRLPWLSAVRWSRLGSRVR